MNAATKLLLLRPRGVSLVNYLRTIAGYFGTWPMQEATGTTALADNVALALGRNTNENSDFVDWAGVSPNELPDGWAAVSRDATNYVTENPAGHCQVISDGAGVGLVRIQKSNVFVIGKSYKVTSVCDAHTLGSAVIRDSSASWTLPVNAVGTFSVTFVAASADIQITAANCNVTLNSLTVQQTGILDSRDYPGAEELVDGDMEAATTAAWAAVGATTVLSKETVNPHSGTQVLRVTDSIGGNPIARQTILTVGKRYRFIGYARSDGNTTPRVTDGISVLWSGVNTHTNWQEFDFEAIATGTGYSLLVTSGTATWYAEWDDCSVTPANPLNGDYVGVTLAQPGAGNVPYFVAFGGAADYLTVLSAEHNSALNPLSFEIVIYGNDFTWDANVRTLLNYYVDASNYIRIDKTATAGQLAVYYQEQGVALVTQLIATGSPAGLFSVGVGNESNVFQATYNGAQSGANQATTSAFVGNFTIMTIGALNTTPTNVTLGSLAYPVEFTALLSAATRLQIKSAFGVA